MRERASEGKKERAVERGREGVGGDGLTSSQAGKTGVRVRVRLRECGCVYLLRSIIDILGLGRTCPASGRG